VQFVQASRGLIKVQPDQKIVFRAEWDLPAERLKGVRGFIGQLAGVASKAKKAA
jgi:transcription-repair coupling factor (superfamily II helicase)